MLRKEQARFFGYLSIKTYYLYVLIIMSWFTFLMIKLENSACNKCFLNKIIRVNYLYRDLKLAITYFERVMLLYYAKNLKLHTEFSKQIARKINQLIFIKLVKVSLYGLTAFFLTLTTVINST